MSASWQEIEERRAQMRHWYWYGIPTFFKCPWNEDPKACDIGLVGIPHSTGNGSTERDQHLGPRSVRHVSGRLRRAHQAFHLTPWEACAIHDLGDVPLPEANNNEASVQHIQDYFEHLDAAGTRPVSFGGDHAVTGPIIKALGGEGSKLSGGRKLALVHFDAHRDDYDHMPHWLGAVRSAAHWGRLHGGGRSCRPESVNPARHPRQPDEAAKRPSGKRSWLPRRADRRNR